MWRRSTGSTGGGDNPQRQKPQTCRAHFLSTSLVVQAGAIQAGVANLTNLMGWQADMIKAALQQLEVLNGQTGQILENQMQMINLLASVDAKVRGPHQQLLGIVL